MLTSCLSLVFGFDQDEEAQDNFFTTSASGFLKFYEMKQFIDCIIVCGSDNKEYHAHKLILGYSSQFFFDTFHEKAADPIEVPQRRSPDGKLVIGSREELEGSSSRSSLKSISRSSSQDGSDETHSSSSAVGSPTAADSSRPAVMRVKLAWQDTEEILPSILHYMYTGRIALTPQNCVLISATAERLQMPKLQIVCKHYIQGTLQRENAVEFLLEASKYKAQNLLKRSISNVARNFCHLQVANIAKLSYAMLIKVLSQELLAVTEEYQLYQAICNYCELHHDTLSKANILKLMGYIRFRWFTYEQFIEVSSNPLVPRSLLIEATMARLMSHELSAEEVTKRSATLPTHLQRRPKLKLLFEYSPPSAGGSVASTSSASSSLSASTGSMAAPSTVLSQSTSSLAVTNLHNPVSALPDLASVLASASSGNLSASSTSVPVKHPDIYTGVVGWIATNSYREAWRNPHVAGRVKVHSSSLAKGSRSTLVDKVPSEAWTADIPSSWISIDLGPYRRLTLNYYTLRHGLNFKADALRTWDLQGSNDGINWKTIKRHTNDKSLHGQFVVASWPVQNCTDGYRFFRVLQTGHNSSNHNFLALSGFEFYGWLDITG